MKVEGLNHVNIVAGDLDRTVAFYETVLGMKAETIPNMPAGFDGRWICDEGGLPIIHVQKHNPLRHGALGARDGTTGAIDHVALACSDFAGMVRRCAELGVPHRVNDRQFGTLRQVFVTDPDNVVLELNFAGD
ncbi:VOC family protein [Novosphingobium album (ex Liu et al. 2023)]|uniref:VOC family protein n=1 Tax=Novosphingobium album (ex Liu et al. 2023) TaxID=3031130 RepID=A0ABT5WVN4_9SPHN|nr:VOC family protein [Novosphingobium album (ex Liu et al. 2023)]MDE8653964.1 VOC family protein [Novosphingobium album (ex Liu et al. 2023)]